MTSAQLALGDPIVHGVGMVMVPIPAGNLEKPQHRVKITKPFYLSVYEVTQQQYEKVMGSRPWQGKSGVQDGPDNAATHVGWDDAVKFCLKLSDQEGAVYHLPTEAQWEYACRAGTTTNFSFGDDVSKLGQHAWFSTELGEEYAHHVGQKLPNPWGLYDMHGNVQEWCQDWYAYNYGSQKALSLSDPVGPAQGEARVLRGGSFGNRPGWLRSATRNSGNPDLRIQGVGFRAVRIYP